MIADLILAAAVLFAAVLVGAIVGVGLRRRVLVTARVDAASMEPTLRPGQRVLARRVRRIDDVRRGDVVLVRSAELGRTIVKRVVGLPHEQIRLDRQGRVWVNGKRWDEPAARPVPGPTATFSVPAASLFLLGDNRAASSDSRRWSRPFLPEHALVGTVITGSPRGDDG